MSPFLLEEFIKYELAQKLHYIWGTERQIKVYKVRIINYTPQNIAGCIMASLTW